MNTGWISTNEAAKYVGLSVETVRRATRAGRLRGVKVNGGRMWRTRHEWVDAWLTQHTKGDTGEEKNKLDDDATQSDKLVRIALERESYLPPTIDHLTS